MVTRGQRLRYAIQQFTRSIGNKVERTDGGIHISTDLTERPQAAVGNNNAEQTVKATTQQVTTEIPTTAEPTTVEPTTDVPTTAKSTTIEPTTAKPTEPETSKDDGDSNSNGGGRCYFNGFSIEVPEDYTYEVDGDKVTFYESYNHEHPETGSDGFLFAIDWTYDGTVSIDSRRLGSKDGKYFMYIHPTGFGMLEDEYANQRMVDARAETDDVLSSFRVE